MALTNFSKNFGRQAGSNVAKLPGDFFGEGLAGQRLSVSENLGFSGASEKPEPGNMGGQKPTAERALADAFGNFIEHPRLIEVEVAGELNGKFQGADVAIRPYGGGGGTLAPLAGFLA